MSRSPSRKDLVELDVEAADKATEIFVVNGKLQRIARGVGHISLGVPPGVYKIRFRSGSSQRDELIEVDRGGEAVQVTGPFVPFTTAAPIEHAVPSRESHRKAARDLSVVAPHRRAGEGSKLFLFVSDPVGDTKPRVRQGVSIHTADGELLATLDEGECDSRSGFCGLTLELNPGTYRVRSERAELGALEMFVVTSAGWQTQVFALDEDFSTEGAQIGSASLRNASIQMAELEIGFDPSSKHARLAELLRLGLQSGRDVLPESFDPNTAQEIRENPMLGIFAAHLLIRRSKIDHALVEDLIRALTRRLGPHPDVQSLLLRPGTRNVPPNLVFPEPPMLRSSWDLIVRGTRKRMSIVPRGTETDRISEGLVSSVPWLLHRLGQSDAHDQQPVSFAEASRLLSRILGDRESTGALEAKGRSLRAANALNPLEQDLLNVTLLRQAATGAAVGSVAEVVREIDAPNYAVARSVKSLSKKLGMA